MIRAGEIKTMTDYDRRQYLRVLAAVSDTSVDIKSLGDIVATLEFLLSQLQEADTDWAKALWREWWNLEELYAFSLSENDGRLETAGQTEANTILGQIRSVIQERLGISDDKS